MHIYVFRLRTSAYAYPHTHIRIRVSAYAYPPTHIRLLTSAYALRLRTPPTQIRLRIPAHIRYTSTALLVQLSVHLWPINSIWRNCVISMSATLCPKRKIIPLIEGRWIPTRILGFCWKPKRKLPRQDPAIYRCSVGCQWVMVVSLAATSQVAWCPSYKMIFSSPTFL